MVCIYCSQETSVINSRPQKRANTIWRRRKCNHCQAIFTTGELVDLEKSLVVVSDGSFKPFLRDKLFVSVYESLRHRKTALADATALTDTIISRVVPKSLSGSLDKEVLLITVVEVLDRFDKVAATHFAAYHPVTSR